MILMSELYYETKNQTNLNDPNDLSHAQILEIKFVKEL